MRFGKTCRKKIDQSYGKLAYRQKNDNTDEPEQGPSMPAGRIFASRPAEKITVKKRIEPR
jgi:hypothetical protein